MSERHEIAAVHERNLEEVLKGVGLLDSVKDGKVVCKLARAREYRAYLATYSITQLFQFWVENQ